MNIGNVTYVPNNSYSPAVSEVSGNAPKFTIPKTDEQKTKRPAVQNSGADAVSAMESMTNTAFVSEPSYTITDEEKEYFRDKYGEEYDEEKVGELYYELADKGIISETDAGEASGIGAVRLVDLSHAVYRGLGNCSLVSLVNDGAIKVRAGKRQYVEGTAFTDERAYKKEYDDFNSQYGKEINTWKDALQKHMDFLDYFRELSLKAADTSEKRYPSGIGFEMWQESLEKTKRVVEQIFG